MGKAQKTMMVPEDLYRLISAQERQTGSTFTRQAIAAFLQYFFADPNGPDPIWMNAVIAIENGEISLADLVAERKRSVEIKIDIVNKSADRCASNAEKAGKDVYVARLEGFHSIFSGELENTAGNWGMILARPELDPVEKIAAFWQAHPRQRIVHVSPPWPGDEKPDGPKRGK